MKTIVTHFSPDCDALSAVWLLKRFFPGFAKAKVSFVPAGETLNGDMVDSRVDIIHVDTGFGRFDHHQTNADTCAAKLVLTFLRKKGFIKKKEEKALVRIVFQINEIDHFRQVYWEQASSDRYVLGLEGAIDGLKLLYPNDSEKIIELALPFFDGIFKQMINKVWAEKIIEKEGSSFKTKWGKTLALETTNDEAVSEAQKLGFRLVIRKDPRKGYVRIKCWPEKKLDLTPIYQKLRKRDNQATWFLHVSKNMVLNGSTKNPKMKPTKLELSEIIDIIKKI